MQSKFAACVVASVLTASAAMTQDRVEGRRPGNEVPKRNIVVPIDQGPIKVKSSDIIRIDATAMAGSSSTISVTGNAQVVSINNLERLGEGGPVYGSAGEKKVGAQSASSGAKSEYEVKPGGKGEFKVFLSLSLPNGDKPSATVYSFIVE